MKKKILCEGHNFLSMMSPSHYWETSPNSTCLCGSSWIWAVSLSALLMWYVLISRTDYFWLSKPTWPFFLSVQEVEIDYFFSLTNPLYGSSLQPKVACSFKVNPGAVSVGGLSLLWSVCACCFFGSGRLSFGPIQVRSDRAWFPFDYFENQ